MISAQKTLVKSFDKRYRSVFKKPVIFLNNHSLVSSDDNRNKARKDLCAPRNNMRKNTGEILLWMLHE